jgi:hypothetical protein
VRRYALSILGVILYPSTNLIVCYGPLISRARDETASFEVMQNRCYMLFAAIGCADHRSGTEGRAGE